MTYTNRLIVRVRRAMQTEQVCNLEPQRRALDRQRRREDRTAFILDCVIAALVATITACITSLIKG